MKGALFIAFHKFATLSVTISALFSRYLLALFISYTPIYNAHRLYMDPTGCPLQGTKFAYCSSCAQKETCVFLQILKKLEDIEKRINAPS